jgi:hypothetical protein
MTRHKCTKELYQAFLQASSVRYSGLALSEVSPFELSHDSISRWLSQKELRPRDVWQKAQAHIDKQEPCLLIVDDTVLDKQYSSHIELVQYQYSGNEHEVIPGIGLVNLLWYGLEQEEAIRVDYRIYDKGTDGKTKNTHFCDMLSLAKSRGLNPDAVVMDTWYSSLKNLKTIRNHGWEWVTPLRKNRIVNRHETLEKIDIPEEGRQVHLRGYGWITVFKFVAKNGRIDYVATSKENPSREEIKDIIAARWSIEVYHRELKQTCGIERCQARHGRSQRNHIYMSIMAWFNKHTQCINKSLSMYQQDWQVIKKSIALEIKCIMVAS